MDNTKTVYQDGNGNSYMYNDLGERVYVNQKPKKKGFFRSIKDGFINWFDGLTPGQQLGMIAGTWFAAGLIWGSDIEMIKNAKRNKNKNTAYYEFGYQVGHIDGEKDAYKEMANNNPFNNCKVTEVKKF